MPFGLKNAGATYQRCMLNCFRDLIGQTIEAYIDDIVVKSKWADNLVVDLEQTFAKLQANGIKLNPEKCVFGVPRGMLLKALVWFWLIDETLSANLGYQSYYEIGSTTPSDEAMAKIMTMVMAWRRS